MLLDVRDSINVVVRNTVNNFDKTELIRSISLVSIEIGTYIMNVNPSSSQKLPKTEKIDGLKRFRLSEILMYLYVRCNKIGQFLFFFLPDKNTERL